MNHLENHPHAFIDESGKVAQVLLFDGHDSPLLNQVKEELGFVEYKCCCDLGMAYVDGDLYNGKFYPPKPNPEWVRDEQNGTWVDPATLG